MNFKEGAFYGGFPGYSIKINEKLDDEGNVRNVMIYDHTKGGSNTTVILADSGKMYTAYNDAYLVLELFRGNSYVEQASGGMRNSNEQYVRQKFDESKLVLSLASFGMDRTPEQYFSDNKMMKNIDELHAVTDSIRTQRVLDQKTYIKSVDPFYAYFQADTSRQKYGLNLEQKEIDYKLREIDATTAAMATNKARNIKTYTASYVERLKNKSRDINNFEIEVWRKYTQSASILIMFLIGAPLGAIIKKGGLGVPVIISILFFIIMYVLSIIGEKWAREGLVPVGAGMVAANMILLPVGLFFLYQARNDSSLLEIDFWRKLLTRLRRNKL